MTKPSENDQCFYEYNNGIFSYPCSRFRPYHQTKEQNESHSFTGPPAPDAALRKALERVLQRQDQGIPLTDKDVTMIEAALALPAEPVTQPIDEPIYLGEGDLCEESHTLVINDDGTSELLRDFACCSDVERPAGGSVDTPSPG